MSTLLFAILTSSCASQNAMSLIPDSVRLDLARDKAAKGGPVSVDEMLSKARAGAVPVQGESVKGTTPPSGSEREREKGEPARTVSLEATKSIKQNLPPELSGSTQHSYDVEPNSADIFRLAQAMHGQHNQARPNVASKKGDVQLAHGPEAQWREILEQAQNYEGEPDPDAQTAAFYADADRPLTTAALPETLARAKEMIAIAFDPSLARLTKDDDLHVRLLRHGKRHPEMIVIGKVEGVQGFAAMQKALSLGKLISDASGGSPGISYDPALSPRTAELHYAKPDHAQ